MAAIQKSASVDFQAGTINVQDGGYFRRTMYNSRSAEQQILVHVIALRSLGYSLVFVNRVDSLEEKIVHLERTMEKSRMEQCILALQNMKVE